MKLVNLHNGQTLAEGMKEAATFFQRFRGLMFTKDLPEGNALHIRPCRSIHTFFMNYPIDVLYVDASQQIVETEQNLLPSKLGKAHKQTVSVIELPAGTVEKTGTIAGHFIQIKNDE